MSKLLRTVSNYWTDIDSYVFSNYTDALLSVPVLILLPLFSLLTVIVANSSGFWAYTFPVISVGLAGAYDSYGRYGKATKSGAKIVVRIVLDLLACFFAAVATNTQVFWLKLIAPILLILSGLVLVAEVILRVSYAMKMSPWYPID